MGWHCFVAVEAVHPVQLDVDVGPMSDPHVVTGPASQPLGGAAGGTGLAAVPQTLPPGTQTLSWSPEYELSGVHVVPVPHSSPFGHPNAQNVSP